MILKGNRLWGARAASYPAGPHHADVGRRDNPCARGLEGPLPAPRRKKPHRTRRGNTQPRGLFVHSRIQSDPKTWFRKNPRRLVSDGFEKALFFCALGVPYDRLHTGPRSSLQAGSRAR